MRNLRDLVPYVRAWYGTDSEYVWVDDDGTQRTIAQDRFEQGHALMLVLVSVALKPASVPSKLGLGPASWSLLLLGHILLPTAHCSRKRAPSAQSKARDRRQSGENCLLGPR